MASFAIAPVAKWRYKVLHESIATSKELEVLVQLDRRYFGNDIRILPVFSFFSLFSEHNAVFMHDLHAGWRCFYALLRCIVYALVHLAHPHHMI